MVSYVAQCQRTTPPSCDTPYNERMVNRALRNRSLKWWAEVFTIVAGVIAALSFIGLKGCSGTERPLAPVSGQGKKIPQPSISISSASPSESPSQFVPKHQNKIGDTPRGFVGTWSGLAKTASSKGTSTSLIISLVGGKLAETVGTAEYGTWECTADMTLITASKESLKLQLEFPEEDDCAEGIITLTLRDADDLHYRYEENENAPTATAKLKRAS
jgi:hypothetical protein